MILKYETECFNCELKFTTERSYTSIHFIFNPCSVWPSKPTFQVAESPPLVLR